MEINNHNHMILVRSLTMVYLIIIVNQPCIPGINPLSYIELFSQYNVDCVGNIYLGYFAPVLVSDICLSNNVIFSS